MITGDSYIGSNRQHRLSDQVSANTLQEVKHRKARIAHRGIRAIPDTIFGSHTILSVGIGATSTTGSRHLGSSTRQCAEKPARAPNSSVVMLVPVPVCTDYAIRT